MQKYVCPKCHAVMWSSKKPMYCICGGKYQTTKEILDEILNGISVFKLDDLSNGIIDGIR